ncbi:ImuA family protein [Altericroceibacterium xinjiangense]|uniref:ImuA family protein n=1 Tax=Altericroceibacterium xinjiangense TaxID=762261 RepID=UPI000F7E1306|nr:protein ImuA [Altericroceibacterium xinjiangense]
MHLTALRAEVRAIESGSWEKKGAFLPFGVADIDSRLKGGGFATGALHEATGVQARLNDEAAACLFITGIAARLAQNGGTVLWALSRRELFAPALAQAGLPPDRLIQAECGRNEDVLAVMEEGLRHGGLAAVVGEIGKAGMAATRRLQLAAEESGVTALMLKRWRGREEDPLTLPSAAVTRWRVGCAPSRPLPVAGIGRACWNLELARQRGGESHSWIVESTDAQGRLALFASSADRTLAPERRLAG